MLPSRRSQGFTILKRVHELVRRFSIPSGCIINKSDLNPETTEQVKAFLAEAGIRHLADLPYDESFTRAMVQGKTIVELDSGELKNQISACWNRILDTANA